MKILTPGQKKLLPFVFSGLVKIPALNFAKKFRPKKYSANAKYIVICAVYNVERYLDDFLCSIIKSRLDFKKNIAVILVDDGSSDNSGAIIQKYTAKFPQNILYIRQKNAGQGAARNAGLDLIMAMKNGDFNRLKSRFGVEISGEFVRNFCQNAWINFADSDDFLDRDFFYSVDKFLGQNSENIAMIATKIIFYREKMKVRFKDSHPLNFKFQKNAVLSNENLDNFIQLSAASAFFRLCDIKNGVKFAENLPKFEDAFFVNHFLLENLDKKSAFLKDAVYFYRKRANKSSTLDNLGVSRENILLKNGYLALLNLAKNYKKNIPKFIQNVVIYDLFWLFKNNFNADEFALFSPQEKNELWANLGEIFALIDAQNILDFEIVGLEKYQKIAILSLFKNYEILPNTASIRDFDPFTNEICLNFFSPQKMAQISLEIDGEKIAPMQGKITTHTLFDRAGIFEFFFYFKLPKTAKNFTLKLNAQNAALNYQNRTLNDMKIPQKTMQKLSQKLAKNAPIWLFADMAFRADDNAEHLYRYIKNTHPNRQIFFSLRKNSPDFLRLKSEGFKIVDPKSLAFKKIALKAEFIISSHIDRYMFEAVGRETLDAKKFIFLQHGVTKDNISKWLNTRKIHALFTATTREFHSIADDFSPYILGKKQVFLTGFARHDALLKKSCQTPKTRQILIMPTWRQYLSGTYSKRAMKRRFNADFFKSEYFLRWQEFLRDARLEKLAKEYDYSVVFAPHPQVGAYLGGFLLPPFIKVATPEMPLQSLFCQSLAMITDFSSVAYEMAFLGRPVLYYQFDESEFFGGKHWQRGYFDYRRDGFGAVCADLGGLIFELENLLKNECVPSGFWAENIASVFAFKDGRNCERIYKNLSKMSAFGGENLGGENLREISGENSEKKGEN